MPPLWTVAPAACAGGEEDFLQFGADRIAKRDVGDDAFAEERVRRAALGAVEELVGQDDFARRVIVLERADRADADDPFHAKLLHAMDIGAVRNFARQELVAAGVAGQEDDLVPGELALDVGVRGRAERRVEANFLLRGEGGELVKTAAADDSDRRGKRHSVKAVQKGESGHAQKTAAGRTTTKFPIRR